MILKQQHRFDKSLGWPPGLAKRPLGISPAEAGYFQLDRKYWPPTVDKKNEFTNSETNFSEAPFKAKKICRKIFKTVSE